MKKIVTGIVAHVDAGKTTLSEALLYQTGALRQLGRVDNGDAFLDPDSLEKKRGITIFSHQAKVQSDNLSLTLLDTPGHVDFASQTEQVLSVLDYAILVVSATDGVQGYTRTLWHLLEHYKIPVFIFINKMDAVGADKDTVLTQLKESLSDGCIAFDNPDMSEEIAMQDDDVLEKYLDSGDLEESTIQQMIKQREVFPCYFGSALKLEGVDELLAGINKWTIESNYPEKFSAKVFKISHDDKGERLTWIRVTGGELKTKAVILDEQKVNQLRVYNGAKFDAVQSVSSGDVCAIPGFVETSPGQGIGDQPDEGNPTIQPVLNYAVDPNGNDIHNCLVALRELEDEDPQLHVTWSSHLQEIRVQIMGEVQLEILQQMLADRFDLEVHFGEGSILYKETISQAVEGVGHFEPLRHYSEVHLLIKPLPRDSGLVINSKCSLEILSRNWQHQVLTNLKAKEELGVLIGAPITDMEISLVSGKSSNVHSVGGDFREATWRAVRQGLMMLLEQKQCQLLEPWYSFRLEVPQDQVGRAMNDIQRMNGNFDTPENGTEMATITGFAPVSEMQDYTKQVNAYTHGQGNLECLIDGYRPCHNADEIISEHDYQPVSDLENTPDSVFCAHGAGYPVPWNEVPEMAHVPYVYLNK
ncbi:elongation factor G [Companilactobacillus mishanensis]|uniref:TetM/TetW/TetO/TetS family tetracycline resistance ribosomal protection protein n=1 Tax=Companilactobacillus mishanensis TaxID=2486008 RepID=A0ABW9P829_9LACO|nr:TetM/TetW/TetO/TetS family tetracycline resistance ribosomal protection protein [Companilactobacillus mishanensis]MQS45308.1 TetM/TetW/TetO/TetS family tetracycline resistance ribosomal protection protein [Companilactobacillus mishanensis]